MNEIRMQCVVLYAGPYRIVDEITREVNEGISLQFLMKDNLQPTEEKGIKGSRAAKGSVVPECLPRLGPVPGVYDLCFQMAVNAQGKAMMKVVDLDYICGVSLLRDDKKK